MSRVLIQHFSHAGLSTLKACIVADRLDCEMALSMFQFISVVGRGLQTYVAKCLHVCIRVCERVRACARARARAHARAHVRACVCVCACVQFAETIIDLCLHYSGLFMQWDASFRHLRSSVSLLRACACVFPPPTYMSFAEHANTKVHS